MYKMNILWDVWLAIKSRVNSTESLWDQEDQEGKKSEDPPPLPPQFYLSLVPNAKTIP